MKKYLFNQMFDEDVIEKRKSDEIARLEEERIAAENAPPTYTVEELEAAKQVALQQGITDGRAEAMTSINQHASITLDSIERQIGGLLSDHKTWTATMHHDAVSLAMAIMRKLAPELLRGSELPQVEHIITEAFQFLTDQPKVMIRVASDLEEQLLGKVNLMASRVGYEGQVVLTGDPELELTDCRVSWYAGAVERSLDETWGQIDEMVDRVLQGLPARERPEPAADAALSDDPDGDADTQTTIEDTADRVVPDPEAGANPAARSVTDQSLGDDSEVTPSRAPDLPAFDADETDIPTPPPSSEPEQALATQELEHG